MRNPGTGSGQRGSALLAVLWMSAALAAIALSVSALVRSETDRVSGDADGLRASYLSSGAVERGIQWMLWGWSSGNYANPDGTPRFWQPNLPRMSMHFPSGDAVVEMIPEMSKLNVNAAPRDDLYRLVLVLTGDEARANLIADGIINWRSPGAAAPPDFLNLSPNSGAPPTFQPPHTSLQEIEELLLVPGVTPDLFYGNFAADSEGRLYARGGLRDSLSVWGSLGGFDINTVSPALMEAVGVPADAVRQIVALRSIRPIRNMGDVGQFGPLPRLGIGGNLIWTLRATARLRLRDGTPSDVVRTSSATVKLLDRRQYYQMPLHVLRYYDDAWSQLAIAPPAAPPPPPAVLSGSLAP